jgi:hypothetical protein
MAQWSRSVLQWVMKDPKALRLPKSRIIQTYTALQRRTQEVLRSQDPDHLEAPVLSLACKQQAQLLGMQSL